MTSKQKRIVALCLIGLLLFLFGYWLFPKDSGQPEYIFDNSYDIKPADVHKSKEHIDFDNMGSSRSASSKESLSDGTAATKPPEQEGIELRALFSEGLINSYTTLNFFKHLEHKFRESTTLGEHFNAVKEYLLSEFSEKEAKKLFETYKEYLQCEMDLLDEYKGFAGVQSSEEAIEMLKQIQAFRRDRLGKELADKLFGTDVKAKEYAFRRAAIVKDDTLYGKEKEKRLAELNEAMWGDETATLDTHKNAYNQYQEKLQIYKKDLNAAGSPEARRAKIRKFREEFFSPEVVAKFEEIDRQMAEKAEQEESYRKQAEAIRSSEELSEKAKERQLQSLQNEVFGDDAEAFRRREAIRKGREKLKGESSLTVEDLPKAGQR
ncbi:MAG: hypothetical protein KGY61_03050 [Desulfobacterales bacterium]|nr:hypothetical protein [Desulfobacterales bacterium]